MFIEYRGEFVQQPNANIESVWLIAKNKMVPNVEHLVKMVVTAKQYQCSYESKPNQLIKDFGMN